VNQPNPYRVALLAASAVFIHLAYAGCRELIPEEAVLHLNGHSSSPRETKERFLRFVKENHIPFALVELWYHTIDQELLTALRQQGAQVIFLDHGQAGSEGLSAPSRNYRIVGSSHELARELQREVSG
jgi:hypothetical protein